MLNENNHLLVFLLACVIIYKYKSFGDGVNNMNVKIETKWTTNTDSPEYLDALKVRHEVFVVEQGVSIEEEIDELENETDHLVIYENSEPIAAARIYDLGSNTYKAHRVCVLKDARGKGYGVEIMHQIELRAQKLGARRITLGAQNTAIPFYEKLGYQTEGEEFLDAGIPHHTMTKII